MPHHDQERFRDEPDWARQVPWERGRGPYRDYGWERGQSVLPEFRDPSVRVMPYERERVSRWRNLDWDEEYNRGTWDVPGPYRGIGPKGYQRSDPRIFDDVCERLTRHGQIDARRVRVEVKNGEVNLTGTVDSRRTRRMIEDLVDQIRGVKDINNQLKIDESQSGMPGGGKGRIDRVGGSGVYPASGPMPGRDAETQGMASWGQGERGAAGYEDSGRSELHPPDRNREQDQGKR